MPLLSLPSVPPGFPPKTLVAPEVFEQMQIYMNCTDPEERRIREYKMMMALHDLSANPGAQSSYLRLEDHPRISGVQNKDVREVYKPKINEVEAAGTSMEGRRIHSNTAAMIGKETIVSRKVVPLLKETRKKIWF